MNAVQRPRTLPLDLPVLDCPSPPALTAELADIVRKLSPAGDIEEAWLEFDRRLDAFRATPAASAYWGDRAGLVRRATGLSLDAAAALDRAYWAWESSFIDHDELERRERRRRREALAGEQFCGYCGGRFKDIDAMLNHQGNCSFAPKGSLGIETWRGKA